MPTSTLDTTAAQAVFAARLFERAVHDPGPWTVTWGPHEVEATRRVTLDGVTFEATFPEACYLTEPGPNAVLRCRGEVMGIRALDFPGDTSFAISWALAAQVHEHERI